ncbi:hypothetical protein QOV31_005195 (plasmid) [Agrobacterium fabrum]|nr:hypothetical protein QOV31_005195 [Agrobacterium fabrum]
MLVEDRRFWTRAAEGGARGEDELEVLIRFLVPEVALGDLEQPAKFDQSRNASTNRCLKNLVANPAEAECAKPGLVGDAKQVVAFGQGTNGAAFAFREAALGALHEAAPPSIRRGVAHGVERRQSGGRSESATRQCKRWLQREAVRVLKPYA